MQYDSAKIKETYDNLNKGTVAAHLRRSCLPAELVAGLLEARPGFGGGREGKRVVRQRRAAEEKAEFGSVDALVARRSRANRCRSRRRKRVQRLAKGFGPRRGIRK